MNSQNDCPAAALGESASLLSYHLQCYSIACGLATQWLRCQPYATHTYSYGALLQDHMLNL